MAAEATGTFKITTAGDYKFKIVHDDGVILSVDNVKVLENWTYRTDESSDVPLLVGNHDLNSLYENGHGGAHWIIYYKGPDTSNAYQLL